MIVFYEWIFKNENQQLKIELIILVTFHVCFFCLDSKKLMKLRTLQLIGGAGRGTCCLLSKISSIQVKCLSTDQFNYFDN